VLKLVQSDRPRLLIADDVGVGRTIEAGLVIKELQARQQVDSVLIVCPKPLVTENKWHDELRRFDEDFVHLDGNALRHCLSEYRLEGQWPVRYRKAILPFSLLDEKLLLGVEGRRAQPGLAGLEPPPRFDLLIVDEAHHARNRDTWRYRNVEQLVQYSDAVVFLSATPVLAQDIGNPCLAT
jgi:SNF2 family DNA or RNA helicase